MGRLLSFVLIVFLFCSCDNFSKKKAHRDYVNFASGYQEEIKEEPKKPELTAIDCEKMLESFCTEFFSSCFKGRKYESKSLVVKEFNHSTYDEKRYEVEGEYSYKGKYGRLYTDKKFTAVIYEKDDSYYEIIFSKYSDPDLFHNQAYVEKGTRNVTYYIK